MKYFNGREETIMTKSKKTTLKLLICVLALLALATTLVACNIGNVPDHYDYLVTFEYNVGTGDNALKCNMSTQYLGVDANSLVAIQPGYDTKFEEGLVNGYYLEGWYLPAEVDENGAPKRDENGFVILARNKWNFDTDRVNRNITLYGKFVKKLAVRFINRVTGKYIEDIIEYKPNDMVREPTSQAPTLKDHTFLGKYYDADGNKYQWDFRIHEDVTVYVDFLEGIWSLVSTEDQFVTAIGAKRNIYLLNDLNFEGKTPWGNSSEYTGIIEGNKHTVSNVKQEISLGKLDEESSYGGVFGALGEKAEIRNITFENVTVSLTMSPSYKVLDVYVGILAGTVADGAKLENVAISGSLTYRPSANKTVHAGEVQGDNGVKGVIGQNKGNNDNIKDCNFTAEVTVA